MDRSPRPARQPLPLLLLFCCAPWETAVGRTVNRPATVTSFLGDSATLPCSLTPDESVSLTQVTWLKRVLDGPKTVAVFHPSMGTQFSEPGRLKFLDRNPWNASLTMSHLRGEDEGDYECQLATFPGGTKISKVRLQVIAQPTNSLEVLNVSSGSEPQDVAKCVSTGGRPPALITWPSRLNGKPYENREPGPQPTTTTVTSFLSLVPSRQLDGQTVTCEVQHESLQEPELLSSTISVLYPPEVSIAGYDDNWYMGRADVTLTCEADSKPEPTSYEWSVTNGSLPASAEAQGNRLRVSTVDYLMNTTVFCKVTNDLGSSKGQVTIRVKETSESLQQDSGLSTASIVTIAVVMILVFILGVVITMVVLSRKRGHCLQSRPTEKKEVLYSAVENNVSITRT